MGDKATFVAYLEENRCSVKKLRLRFCFAAQ